ncbi:MAG TPA: ABC transporter permease [Terriglobales bacterium]|nr:ABC transporter permease [Terriglobales bacterium]
MTGGVLIGIASLALLTSVGEATKHLTMQRFKNMIGTFDTLMVRPGGAKSRGMPTLVNVPPTLRFDDAQAIAQLPEIKSVAEMQSAFDIDIKYRDKTASPGVFGVSPNWLALRSDELAEGNFFTEEQNSALARVAVIGTDVRSALFPEEDPLGKTIRIAEVPFQVIGILQSRGAGPAGGSLDNVILIPVSTASRRLFNRDYLTMLIAQLRDPNQADIVTSEVQTLLRYRHSIRPPELDDFTVTNPRATMARVTQAGNTLSRILTGVSVLALLIGGAVIMGLMSIAVSERRNEVGVRRSVGASQSDIVVQFMFEALFVALMGGLGGVAIGCGAVLLGARMRMMPANLLWQPFAQGIVLSLVIGLLCGIYPAWKASRIDPIQAIRF